MHNGELEFSNQEMVSSSNFGETPECSSTERLFNEILSDMHACIHTHTCNPPGPDNSHTHTCYHVHTKVVPHPTEDKILSDDTSENKLGKKRALSNKEAVRKYREKNKARVASLEDEVVRLRVINQQLLKRLQGQSVLEAEITRLKCLLVDIRGRIEGEIGAFPYQKPMESGNVYCLQPGSEELNGQGLNSCGFQTLQCLGNQEPKEVTGCALAYGTPTAEACSGNRRKGGKRAAMASWS
ncbi:PREDICTED: basic leucine zipper 23-like isoform X2 [Nicotiana attenuata]|uniref:basic leucine zipper 23-like isoform X2 n=1 Tax=Nicotiana attenuata TaxID=49451 RepID=UPI000904BB4C|nr:PREDICTED: basic leucine zipper 23-like isoform X2 [Nicotiana attenuata]